MRHNYQNRYDSQLNMIFRSLTFSFVHLFRLPLTAAAEATNLLIYFMDPQVQSRYLLNATMTYDYRQSPMVQVLSCNGIIISEDNSAYNSIKSTSELIISNSSFISAEPLPRKTIEDFSIRDGDNHQQAFEDCIKSNMEPLTGTSAFLMASLLMLGTVTLLCCFCACVMYASNHVKEKCQSSSKSTEQMNFSL